MKEEKVIRKAENEKEKEKKKNISCKGKIERFIDFKGMSTRLGLFYA